MAAALGAAVPANGSMTSATLPRSSRYRLAELRPALAPATIHWFARLGSTNTRAAELVRSGELTPPAVVLTGWQVSGRGRGTNTWWSSAGSMTVTFAFPANAVRLAHHLPLLVGVVVRRVATDTLAAIGTQARIQLKWPNDLVVGGRKLAGLLCERIGTTDLVGVGLNVNLDVANAPPLLQPKITSLLSLGGRTLDHTRLLARLGRELSATMASPPPFAQVLEEYRQHHALTGKHVTISDPGNGTMRGICDGLDEEGRLILRSGKHLERVVSGHVEFAAPA
jgi:BirA family biotin operon repressor/biotin-[acetyl-CoA-carboxylase] ligase